MRRPWSAYRLGQCAGCVRDRVCATGWHEATHVNVDGFKAELARHVDCVVKEDPRQAVGQDVVGRAAQLALEHLHQPLVPRLLALVGRKYEREVVAARVHAVVRADGEGQPRVGEVGFAQLLGGVLPLLRQAFQLPPLHELDHGVGEQPHLLGRVREVDGHLWMQSNVTE